MQQDTWDLAMGRYWHPVVLSQSRWDLWIFVLLKYGTIGLNLSIYPHIFSEISIYRFWGLKVEKRAVLVDMKLENPDFGWDYFLFSWWGQMWFSWDLRLKEIGLVLTSPNMQWIPVSQNFVELDTCWLVTNMYNYGEVWLHQFWAHMMRRRCNVVSSTFERKLQLKDQGLIHIDPRSRQSTVNNWNFKWPQGRVGSWALHFVGSWTAKHRHSRVTAVSQTEGVWCVVPQWRSTAQLPCIAIW